ncbi:MAG: DoxX-like family protein [Bacteroidetes bacterium]|nr:DoxX-like family protein [Bacteroidota bacterium]
MAILYILAGANHFVKPKFYLGIMPPYIPWHKAMIYISGAAEIIFGLLLFYPPLSTLGAWGIIVLLIAIFPANIYHLTSAKSGKGIPFWALYLRIPFQGVLILWAWWHTFTR